MKKVWLVFLIVSALLLSSCATSLFKDGYEASPSTAVLPSSSSSPPVKEVFADRCYYVIMPETKDGVEEFCALLGGSPEFRPEGAFPLDADHCFNITPAAFEKAGCGVSLFAITRDGDLPSRSLQKQLYFLSQDKIVSAGEVDSVFRFVSAAPFDYNGDGVVDVLFSYCCGNFARLELFDASSYEITPVWDGVYPCAIYPDPEKWVNPAVPTLYRADGSASCVLASPISDLGRKDGGLVGCEHEGVAFDKLIRELPDSVDRYLCIVAYDNSIMSSIPPVVSSDDRALYQTVLSIADDLTAEDEVLGEYLLPLGGESVSFAFYSFVSDEDLAFAEKTKLYLRYWNGEDIEGAHDFAFDRLAYFQFVRESSYDYSVYLSFGGRIYKRKIPQEVYDEAYAIYRRSVSD